MPDLKYSYAYPRPSLTVDAVIFQIINGDLKVLLIQRGDEPFKGSWAFPGGFVDEGETVDKAVVRELHEETGLVTSKLWQFYTASEPERDPRGWTVSTIFSLILNSPQVRIQAGDDAADAQWHSISKLPFLAFDHAKLLKQLIHRLSDQFSAGFIPEGLFYEMPVENDIENVKNLLVAAKQVMP